jgi:hypothetical protein
MANRYPGYDVLSKRHTTSWNDQTRRVVDARTSTPPDLHEFLNDAEFAILRAVCDCIVPQPRERARPAPVASLIDKKLSADRRDGYRSTRLPPLREAWRRGLAALEAEAHVRHATGFALLSNAQQEALLRGVQSGETRAEAWTTFPAAEFFKTRILHDVVSAYYADPHGWNEIGFGGPASPRGYVRMNYDRRDPWEAAEVKPGSEQQAFEDNRRVGR